MIKLSIIMPVYNSELYLEKSIESIINQDFNDYELICVNDGSNDNSKKILEKYAKKNKKIKIINQENKGVIKARIAGYEAATGKYIAWVDSDDFIEKEMFSRLINAANENKADVVYCNYNFYPKNVINKKKWFNNFEGNVDWKFVMNNTIQWNKIVKKELLDQVKITKLFEEIGEGCYGIVLIKAKKIISINECLYNYRVGHTSLSSNFENIDWYKKVVKRANANLQYVTKEKYSNEWIEYYKYRYLYYNLILLIVSAYNNNKKVFLNCKKTIKENELFGKKYSKYLNKSFSKEKYMFLKYMGINSFTLLKISSKILFKNR